MEYEPIDSSCKKNLLCCLQVSGVKASAVGQVCAYVSKQNVMCAKPHFSTYKQRQLVLLSATTLIILRKMWDFSLSWFSRKHCSLSSVMSSSEVNMLQCLSGCHGDLCYLKVRQLHDTIKFGTWTPGSADISDEKILMWTELNFTAAAKVEVWCFTIKLHHRLASTQLKVTAVGWAAHNLWST